MKRLEFLGGGGNAAYPVSTATVGRVTLLPWLLLHRLPSGVFPLATRRWKQAVGSKISKGTGEPAKRKRVSHLPLRQDAELPLWGRQGDMQMAFGLLA